MKQYAYDEGNSGTIKISYYSEWLLQGGVSIIVVQLTQMNAQKSVKA